MDFLKLPIYFIQEKQIFNATDINKIRTTGWTNLFFFLFIGSIEKPLIFCQKKYDLYVPKADDDEEEQEIEIYEDEDDDEDYDEYYDDEEDDE